jgi:hypothetical protein
MSRLDMNAGVDKSLEGGSQELFQGIIPAFI